MCNNLYNNNNLNNIYIYIYIYMIMIMYFLGDLVAVTTKANEVRQKKQKHIGKQ